MDSVTPANDLWMAAACMYYLATGATPTGDETPEEVRPAHAHHGPQNRARNLADPRLRTLLTRAFAPDPKDRYPSAAEFRAAIDAQRAPPSYLRVHTDVSFPAQVRLGRVYNLRVQVIPAEERLPAGDVRAVPKPHAHDVILNLPVPVQLALSVTTEGLDVEGEPGGMVEVQRAEQSAAQVFRLRGQQIGPGRIDVDFICEGRPVGGVSLTPAVVAAAPTASEMTAGQGEYAARPVLLGRDEALGRMRFLQADCFGILADAWVASTNTNLDPGNTGVALGRFLGPFRGPSFHERVRALGPVPIGAAVVTSIDGMAARYIIHAPILDANQAGGPTRDGAGRAVQAALQEAERLTDVRSVVIPSIGTSWGMAFAESVAPVIVAAVLEHLARGSRLQQVTFANPASELHEAYQVAYRALGGSSERQGAPAFPRVLRGHEGDATSVTVGALFREEMTVPCASGMRRAAPNSSASAATMVRF